MGFTLLRGVALVLCAAFACLGTSADDIEMELRSGVLIKMLREMVNQTKADTMNLPANSTSIRENITDTFSCENRTYGYYADVDNDCQIFHVCLPSQAPTGRNMTYRWSFICPAETVFNQEVLTCTRPRDSIACDESPMFYDVNMEFGKVANESKSDSQSAPETKPETGSASANPPPNTDAASPTPQRWNQANRKKQNIVAESFLKDGAFNTKARKEDIKEYGNKITQEIKDNIKEYNQNVVQTMNQQYSELSHGIHELKEEIKEVAEEVVHVTDDIKESDQEKSQSIKDDVKEKEEALMENIKRVLLNEIGTSPITDLKTQGGERDQTAELPSSILRKIEAMNAEPIAPAVIEETIPFVEETDQEDAVEEYDNSRIASERSMKRKGRKVYRGSLRFKSDI